MYYTTQDVGDGMAKYLEGSEGVVEIKDGYAYKYFKDLKQLEAKRDKIEALKKIDIQGFVMPEELLYDKEGNFIGYKMKAVQNDLDMYDLFQKKGIILTLDKKIEYLLKVEKLIKNAHEKNIILNDCCFWNFLIQDNNEVIGIDTDNFQINGFKTNKFPTYFLSYYKSLTGEKESSFDSDKFSYGLFALRSLLQYPFKLDGGLITHSPKHDFLKNIFRYCDIPDNAKEEIYEFLSTNKEKEWIGKTLEKMSSNRRKYI